jgi:hypothetical protein
VSDESFHAARSHGKWFLFKGVSYFVVVHSLSGKDHVTITSAGKELSNSERMFFKTK